MRINFQPVVGSVILIKHRRMMEVFPSNLRRQWMEWELRVMILISLLTQIFLALLGNRRKRSAGIWLRITLWSAYILADTIATMASSILSNNLGEVYKGDHLDPRNELKAFWAPLFLLHLGVADTVTAYSLEDNGLWKRHLLGLVSQAMTIFYIMFLAWTNSHLSFLFIVMFFVGLVKYLERVWVLYSASENKFRDSIPDIPTNESKIMEDCKLKEMKGYHLTKHHVIEASDHLANTSSNESVLNEDEIVTAYNFLEMVKRLFADLILGTQECDASRAIFENDLTNHEKAFKIIEIELGFIYNFLYTKANVVYSSMGIARRIIGFFSILVVFAMLIWFEILNRDKEHHCRSEIDLIITFVLLAVALLLELCAFCQLLISDHTIHWLINHKMSTITILRAIKCWAPNKRRRLNSAAQLSLLSLPLRKRQLPCRRILKMLGIDELLEIHFAMTTISVDYIDIRWKIFREIRDVRPWAEQNEYSTELKSLFGRRGGRTLKKFNLDLEWSIELEFDQSILIWHLATDILYHLDYYAEPDRNDLDTYKHARGMCLSRYMLYLLVQHPYMLPIEVSHIRFQDIYVGLKDFIEERMRKPVKEIDNQKKVAEILINVDTEDMLNVRGREKSSFVILHACELANALKTEGGSKWDIIISIWIEMLGHAASLCKGRQHAQRLRVGGELLTHVWLLMAHFGLNDHFRVPNRRAIADVIQW